MGFFITGLNRRILNVTALIGLLLIGAISVILLFELLSIASAGDSPVKTKQNTNGWSAVFTETFESGIGASWVISDVDGTNGGEYYWSTTNFTSSEGVTSAWATGGGQDGSLLEPGIDDYPNGAVSSMLHEPVDLSDATDVKLVFDYWLDTEENFDIFQVAVTRNISGYETLLAISGNSGGWQEYSVDLSAYAGDSSVSILFFFSSNAVNTDKGVFLDNISLEVMITSFSYLPLLEVDPTPTPTPTPTPPPYYYFDDFSDPSSGWPVIDNTGDPQDCWKWYYGNGETYNSDICDDRTDVKVSPLVTLPTSDYEIEMDGRFRPATGAWWTSYGILFDAKDDPNPSNPDLGDYYMIWILWEGSGQHKWKLLKDVPGSQISLTGWEFLEGSYYDYGNNGTNFNHWRIVRTDTRIEVYVNDHHLITLNESRPTTNNQVLFGVFSSTFETGEHKSSYDNFLVLDSTGQEVYRGFPQGRVQSGEFDLVDHLPRPDG